MTSGSRRCRPSLQLAGGLFALVFACWIVGAMDQLTKFFHARASLAVVAGAVCIAGLIYWLRRNEDEGSRQLGWQWLVAFWVLLTILYAVLYPLSQRHAVGVGSDSEDALRLSASQLWHHHFPYYPRTYLGNPISPMPGAVFLAVPFYLMGRVSLENPLWLAAFIVFCASFFRLRSTALAFLLVFVVGSAAALNSFVVGNDYVTNAWYICAALFIFLRTYERNPDGWQHWLAGILLGIALSSRAPYVVLLPLMLAYLLQHGRRKIVAWRSLCIPLFVAAAITLPFYFYDPNHFSPLHIKGKLDFLPTHDRSLLTVALPLIALAVASSGFFLTLTMRRVFLIAGLASGVILITPGLVLCFFDHFAQEGWGLLAYGLVPAMLIGLWAFSRLEDGTEPLAADCR